MWLRRGCAFGGAPKAQQIFAAKTCARRSGARREWVWREAVCSPAAIGSEKRRRWKTKSCGSWQAGLERIQRKTPSRVRIESNRLPSAKTFGPRRRSSTSSFDLPSYTTWCDGTMLGRSTLPSVLNRRQMHTAGAYLHSGGTRTGSRSVRRISWRRLADPGIVRE